MCILANLAFVATLGNLAVAVLWGIRTIDVGISYGSLFVPLCLFAAGYCWSIYLDIQRDINYKYPKQ